LQFFLAHMADGQFRLLYGASSIVNSTSTFFQMISSREQSCLSEIYGRYKMKPIIELFYVQIPL